MNRLDEMQNKLKGRKISLASIMTLVVVGIVLVVCVIIVSVFSYYYITSVEENAVTSSDQAVAQVHNMITNYTEDMNEVMDMIREKMEASPEQKNEFFHSLISIRKDIEAVTTHTIDGELLQCWSDGKVLKENNAVNLSYETIPEEEGMHISAPHVQNLFVQYYPWVVTISDLMQMRDGEVIQVSMDIRFSNIAEYVDEVGMGAHGYCFIMDRDGNIVYHPQQQLIYVGLKEEAIELIQKYKDGTYQESGVIYTIKTLENCDWRIVGVSFVDELITVRLSNMVKVAAFVITIVIITAIIAGWILSRNFSKPAKELASAMKRFEKEGETFAFYPVEGSYEIVSLSNTFGHMVLRIQELVDKVRKEEISLRKTELNALQSQINPHFLYNTLDSIAWMCEEGRNKEAVEMVNALARLFRISISKGHELITIQKELQHAECYLKIQKFRYKNQFEYEFKVEDTCLEYLCNKITLQPLIENAIVHGLDMSEKGFIRIVVWEKDDMIFMRVEDNGIGMTEEQCLVILREDAQNKAGIGIKNVNDRVKIYFGEQYGVTINSELDEGTQVEICMPKILEENYESDK